MVSCHPLLVIIFFCLINVTTSKEIKVQVRNGFPLAMFCNLRFKSPKPKKNDKVQCVIARNGATVYSKIIAWKKRQLMGYFVDAEENMNISVTLTHGNRSVTATHKVTILDQYVNKTCPDSETERWKLPKIAYVGENLALGCWADGLQICEKQFKRLTFAFYKDCKRINLSDEITVTTDKNFKRSRLGYLQIKNASYAYTPGSYRCSILYKGKVLMFARNAYQVCVKGNLKHIDRPVITVSQKKYEVSPGKDLTVKCHSKNRESTGSVAWYRENEEICRPFPGAYCKDKIEDATSCYPVSEAEMERKKLRIGILESEYTLRNLNYSSSGTYSCVLHNTGETKRATFTIVVKNPSSYHASPWVGASICTGAFFVTISFGVLLHFCTTTRMRYFVKKNFTKAVKVPENKTIGHLVYCEDIFNENPEDNPLKDLTEWLNGKKLPFSDPNFLSSHSSLGSLFPEHAKMAIENSMSVIILLSEDLLKNNQLENYAAYMGFNNNIEADQPVFFICTKKLKNTMENASSSIPHETDNKEHDAIARTVVTFKKFMKRRKNRVIYWSPNNLDHFHRSLYVALPKVYNPKKTECDDLTCINNMKLPVA